MNRFIQCLFALLILGYSCTAQEPTAEKSYPETIAEHRAEKNVEFKDKEQSPLTKQDRRKFKALEYFALSEDLKVEAKFIRTEGEDPFKMKTSTDRLPEYVKYGEAHFTLGEYTFVLNVYQNIAVSKKPGMENYLFIPFTDLTSGESTYGGGRYLDATIPDGETITLDFNLAYNPYCAYNDGYSCPIPPPENFIKFAIEAGEKSYGEHH